VAVDRGQRAGGRAGWSGGLRGRGWLLPELCGGLLDRRVAGRRPRGAALGPARGSARRVSARRPPSRAHTTAAETRGAPGTVAVAAGSRPFPTAAARRWRPSDQAQLGVGGQHQPGPPVGLLGMARPGVVQPRVCYRTERCVPGRTCGCRPARRDPGRARRGRPTTATAAGGVRARRYSSATAPTGWCGTSPRSVPGALRARPERRNRGGPAAGHGDSLAPGWGSTSMGSGPDGT
jgi:hypothetical protein